MAERILSLAVIPTLARVVAYAGSGLLLFGVFLRQFRFRPDLKLEASIFVGIRALRERALLQDIEANGANAISFLDERTIDSFAGVIRLRASELLGIWWRVARDVADQLRGERPQAGLPPNERRLSFLLNAHKYAYFLSWFSALKQRGTIEEPIVFSAASMVSFAAVAAGFRCAYHLHGFQRQSLVFPDFEIVRCFTRPERDHFKQRLPRADVQLKQELDSAIETERAVAIAGCYGQSVGFDDCVAFIAWAKSERIPVIIRPHPLDHSGFYERWRNDGDVQFSDTSIPFDVFLEQRRPRMLLSWYSTALFDALRRGIVPVTVETERWRSLDMVFPFQDVSLRWPHEKALAESVMANDGERRGFLARGRSVAGIDWATTS